MPKVTIRALACAIVRDLAPRPRPCEVSPLVVNGNIAVRPGCWSSLSSLLLAIRGDQGRRAVVIDAALLPAFVGLSKAREMVLTGDIYTLDQLPPGSIANVVAEPGELDAAVEGLLDRIATYPPPVTAAQRRLFDVWLNNPLDACVNTSMTELPSVRKPGDA